MQPVYAYLVYLSGKPTTTNDKIGVIFEQNYKSAHVINNTSNRTALPSTAGLDAAPRAMGQWLGQQHLRVEPYPWVQGDLLSGVGSRG